MRKIRVVEAPCEEAVFTIDRFAFRLCDEEKSTMINCRIALALDNYQPVDVHFLLEEMEVEFLLTAPGELTDYIRKYEENGDPADECLFHDLRTRYIEFIQNKPEKSGGVQDEVLLAGFNLQRDRVYLVIKSFSLEGLSVFWEKVTGYCAGKGILYETQEDIRWVKLQQYMLNERESDDIGKMRDFLKKTLNQRYFPVFLACFREIDANGYLGKAFYEKVMSEEREGRDGEKIRVPLKQIARFFSPYWRYTITARDRSTKILCLHEEVPEDAKIDEYVYTLKPSLMKYYLKNWFEDFTVEIIRTLETTAYKLRYILPGKRFNFFLDDNPENIREIDLVVGIEKDGNLKLIAMECKKTLSGKEIQTTNKKCREKVIDSGNNVFDAFVHIGCFKGDVTFDRKTEGGAYRQTILEGTGCHMNVPCYAFVVTDMKAFECVFTHIVRDIIVNW